MTSAPFFTVFCVSALAFILLLQIRTFLTKLDAPGMRLLRVAFAAAEVAWLVGILSGTAWPA